ncbi:hypothetical protein [Gloeothece verrucosa]|uniref:Uncharacterized protein n=1 Tax=Gloeothece verrucosa (strain PCC 7822) TaxID=497965 RepID=E0UMA4_GLOV7|nr:hypothetical protein [Gloeothece verrucosa]ADN18084.1 hypothetical protein Cyan7822_6284 [Gloeothece verrucosa PCC 7822]
MDKQQKTADSYIQVVPAFGNKPPFFLLPFLPPDQVQPILYIGALTIVFSAGLGIPVKFGFILFVWFSGVWVGLSGFRPWLFINRFVPLPGKTYTNKVSDFISTEGEPTLHHQKLQLNRKMVKVKNQSGKTVTLKPFQADCDLHGIIEVQLDGYKFAALLLCDKKGKWSANIPFEVEPIHHEPFDEDVVASYEALSNLCEYLVDAERIKFYIGKKSDVLSREKQLERDIQNCEARGLTLNAFLHRAEKQRSRELTAKGLRQIWEQRIYCSWRYEKALARKNDWLGNFIGQGMKIWNGFAQYLLNTQVYHQKLTYAKLGQSLHSEGFMPWQMILRQKGKLIVSPLSAETIWRELWYRFNPANSSVPAIPQLIQVSQDSRGQVVAEVQQNYRKDILSILLMGANGKKATPDVTSRDWVFCNGQYIAAMSLDGGMKQQGKPKSYGTYREALRFLFNKLNSSEIRDVEFWVELEPSNLGHIEQDLDNTAKRGSANNKHAAQQGRVIDVAATMQQQESLEAQKLIYDGRKPVSIGFTALIYRQQPQELQRACQHLSHHFGTVKLIEEDQVCWHRWLECLPITVARQLTSTCEGLLTFDPRLVFPSSEAPSLMPLSCPLDLDPVGGIEFLCQTKPLYLNIGNNPYNILVSAKKGGGKSLMSFGLIRHALTHGPVLGLDLSMGGSSTFELVCQMYGKRAAYIDILKTAYNPLMIPDLRKLSSQLRSIRLPIWKSELKEFLVGLIMGTIEDEALEQNVRALLQKALDAFFAFAQIQQRYQRALEAGFGSADWERQPTLTDFLPFCSVERLKLFNASAIQKETLDRIRLMLEAKINDPNIGRVLSQPSMVNPDADLIFFSLSGLSDHQNALAIANIVQMSCTNLGLSHSHSLFVMDECSTIFRASRNFTVMVGKRSAVGRKFGQGTLLIGQDLESVIEAPAASQIMANLDVALIGLINEEAAKVYHQHLGIPRRLISPNASSRFGISSEEFISHWLLRKDGNYWQVDYPISLVELAALANSPDEKKLRQKYISDVPTVQEIVLFAKALKEKFREAA